MHGPNASRSAIPSGSLTITFALAARQSVVFFEEGAAATSMLTATPISSRSLVSVGALAPHGAVVATGTLRAPRLWFGRDQHEDRCSKRGEGERHEHTVVALEAVVVERDDEWS